MQIRAIQLTTNNVSDSQVLGDLLNQISSDELIDSVYTDGAYDTKLCRHVISDRHAHAEIPPRKNARSWNDRKWDKASMHDDQNRSKNHKVFQQYPHLKVFDGEVFHNQKVYIPKQIYIYSQPYKRDVSDPNDMIAFISLYDNPVNPSQYILQCGFIDNVF